jgi:hypothetical protein
MWKQQEIVDADGFVILVKGEILYPVADVVGLEVGIRAGLWKISSGVPGAANRALPRELRTGNSGAGFDDPNDGCVPHCSNERRNP